MQGVEEAGHHGLRRVVRAFQRFHNEHRPHQGIGATIGRGKAPGSIPVQPGRRIRFVAGQIRVGHAKRRGVLIHKDEAKNTFVGTIRGLVLALSDGPARKA